MSAFANALSYTLAGSLLGAYAAALIILLAYWCHKD